MSDYPISTLSDIGHTFDYTRFDGRTEGGVTPVCKEVRAQRKGQGAELTGVLDRRCRDSGRLHDVRKPLCAAGHSSQTDAMRTLQEIWPLFGLHIRSGPVELAAIRDDDIPVLVELAESRIHDPDAMPFAFPWTDVPKDELGRNMAVHY